MNTQALLLVAHGSKDPSWSAPIEAVAARVRQLNPHIPVACAYLELSAPTLQEAAANLVAQGARFLKIFPLFLGLGQHTRRDLPTQVAKIQAQYPSLVIEVMPSAGECPAIINTLAQLTL